MRASTTTAISSPAWATPATAYTGRSRPHVSSCRCRRKPGETSRRAAVGPALRLTQHHEREAMSSRDNLALVTGAAGWLGSRLVGALVHGLPECTWMPQPDPRLRVRCLVLPNEDAALIEELGERVEIVRGDITSEEDCAKLCQGARGAMLFHIAGI